MLSWHARLRILGALVLIAAIAWTLLMVRSLPQPHAHRLMADTTPAMTAPRIELPAYRAPSGLIIPVHGVRPDQLTDTFTQARAGGLRVHDAIDIMAPRGTPVLAAGPGMVEKLFTSKAGGMTIYQRSLDRRTIYYYAHLDSYAPGIRQDQPVRTGQVIGAVGFTGNANPLAPHLHFAVLKSRPEANWYEPTVAINPYPLLTGR